MDEVAEGLLSNIPAGEELRDPREGDYDAPLTAVERKRFDSGAVALQLTFSGMVNKENNMFDFTESVFIPSADSSDGFRRMFVGALHDIGILPRDDKRSRIATTEEHYQTFEDAAKTKVGTVYPIRLKTDSEGQLRLRFRRVRVPKQVQ